MAYMNQEKKAKIAAALKAIPELKGWKYSLSVQHHSTITMTIKSAPIDLIKHLNNVITKDHLQNPGTGIAQCLKDGAHQVNEFHLERQFEGKLLETFKKIKDAMNTGNHDNSDISSDYFDVGHYVGIHIGKWDTPFIHTK